MKTVLFSAISLAMLNSCEPTVESQEVEETKLEKDTNTTERKKIAIVKLGAVPPLANCTKKALYDIPDIDISTYDSISSQYFQEVLDYEDVEAKVIENEIKKLEYNLSSDAAHYYSNATMDSIVNRLTKLKTDIVNFDKILSGYVFIHTFSNKTDTMSAIIITNRDGTDAEAIQVSTINELNPDNYRNRIKR